MRLFSILLLLCGTLGLSAQTTNKLIAYYSLDSCTLTDDSGNGSNGTLFNTSCEDCGVSGGGVRFTGETPNNPAVHSYGLMLGLVNNEFKSNNFTVSFYMKATDNLGTKDIISKGQTCDDNQTFAIRFISSTNSIQVDIAENSGKKAPVSAPLDFGSCWQHIAFVRSGKNSLLYINGVLKDENTVQGDSPINLDNNAVLSIANGPCQGILDKPFEGILDELRIYKKALTEEEVMGLYLGPDKIINRNTTVFLGESIQLEATESCADSYQWSPSNFLSENDILNPICTPDSSIFYTLSFTEDMVCISYDTVRITVIDPADLDCSTVYLPKAFTPNGDNLNDTYGISNPWAIDASDLLSFEIFDRWGSRVFYTDQPFDQWDGAYNGEPINPGVLLYRIRFTCNGEEQIDVGSLAIIR